MTQTGIIIDDEHNDGWINNHQDALIYQGFNPEFGDDEFNSTPDSPSNLVYVGRVSQMVNPEDLTGDTKVRFRARNEQAATSQVDLTVQLRQFYLDEATEERMGELIAETTIVDVPTGYTDFEFTVPDISFVNFLDLVVRILANKI